MAVLTARFRRGGPISLGRRVESGDPAGFTFVAVLKKTVGEVVPKASQPIAATFATTFVDAVGSVAAYWLISITPAVSSTLAPGTYAVDGKLILAGQVVTVVEPVFIVIAESVSG